MANPHHSIKTVARLTGLSPHVIRIWEKRYGAVAPARSDTNRRLYSDSEVERLNCLRMATAAGHSIGNIATLPIARLRSLVEDTSTSRKESVHPSQPSLAPARAFHDSCLQAIANFD